MINSGDKHIWKVWYTLHYKNGLKWYEENKVGFFLTSTRNMREIEQRYPGSSGHIYIIKAKYIGEAYEW